MNPFQAKTVADAVAPLLKVLKNLEAVSELCFNKIEANKSDIARLEAENTTALQEQDHATHVLMALRGIVNPKE